MLGTFPKDSIPSGNFPTVQLLKRQLPKSVLDAALGRKPVLAAALWPMTHVIHCVMCFYQKKNFIFQIFIPSINKIKI